MEIKSMMLVVDDNGDNLAASQAAIRLASVDSAHLVGLYVVDIPVLPSYIGAEMPAQVYDIQRERYLQLAAAAKQRFDEACADARLSGEWRCEEGRTQDVIAHHARYVDLLVVNGPSPTEAGSNEHSHAEDLVLSAGRPVLVCPRAYTGTAIGETIAIAWNGSREAARAVSDAMPLLTGAKKALVFVVGEHVTDVGLTVLPGSELAHYLARHGVEVEVHPVAPGNLSVADALLKACRSQEADLLVMGAYGHSRFREVLLGGATHDALQSSHLPLLMSH